MSDTVPDQLCVFLATVTDPDDQGQQVELTATVDGTSVTVEARRGFSKSEASATLVVQDSLPDPEGLLSPVVDVRDAFIPWLEANRPELDIDRETMWTATVVRPHTIVVMYYLFFSEEWEMGVTWHVTIPPHDWARIYLRRRSSETSPSLAYKISSFNTGSTAVEIPPPEAVWR